MGMIMNCHGTGSRDQGHQEQLLNTSLPFFFFLHTFSSHEQ